MSYQNYTTLATHASTHLSANFCHCRFGAVDRSLVTKHYTGNSVKKPLTASCKREKNSIKLITKIIPVSQIRRIDNMLRCQNSVVE